MTRLLWLVLCALFIGIVTADESNEETSASAASSGEIVACNEPDTTDIPPPTEASTSPEPSKLTCGDHEIVDDCPAECASDRCPRSESEVKSSGLCAKPEVCPPPQCKCQFNYRRAENGTCIPTRSCPPFTCSGVNEEFAACPPLCPTDDCSQASPSGECPPQFGNILIVLPCAPTCRCKKGYWRKNGICVPYEECNTPSCGENEVLDKCPADCPSDYCPKSEEETKSSQFCPQPDPCPPPACKCRLNYRRAENGTCIPTRSCPPFACSGVNEEFNACPPWCPTDDCSQASPEGTCPRRFGRIGVTLICSPKCRCREGYWRKNGLCRPYEDCNIECNNPNEEYVEHKSSCSGSEECFSLVARLICTSTPIPKSGCACKGGFLRVNSTSPCIPICECPQMINSPDCKKQPEVEICSSPNEE